MEEFQKQTNSETNVLSKTYSSLGIIKYTIPTIIMMIFMSAYMIVDGVFVANFVNEDALSAVNIVLPVIMLCSALAMMLAIGSNATIGRMLGQGRVVEGKGFFTTVYIVGIIIGLSVSAIAFFFQEQILSVLGASEELYPYAKSYLLGIIIFIPSSFLQIFTQTFFVTAGKPMLGFLSCLVGGISNIVFDYLLIVVAKMGIFGAALATGIGFSVPAVFGLIYFSVARKSPLCFEKPLISFKMLGYSLYNGSSEFVTSVSTAITTLMFNIILLDLEGENGVAAISVILYLQMLQNALYLGYSFGVSPMISYKYGEERHDQLKKIMSVSFKFLAIVSAFTVIISLVFAEQAVGIFIENDSDTFAMAVNGLRLYSLAYIFMGFNIFASSMFTAFSNGKISALLSVARTLVFIVLFMLTLPSIIGVNGVWLAVPLAELLALGLGIYFYKKYKSVYNY